MAVEFGETCGCPPRRQELQSVDHVKSPVDSVLHIRVSAELSRQQTCYLWLFNS